MKKLWLLGIVVMAVACNNDATTQPSETDHTQNKDTSAVDSMQVFTDTTASGKPVTDRDTGK